MTGLYITRRVVFIAVGIVLTIHGPGLFLVLLGWLCLIANTFDLAFQAGSEMATKRNA